MRHALDIVYENIDKSIRTAKISIGVAAANGAASTIELNPIDEVNRYAAAFAIKAADAFRDRHIARQMERGNGEAISVAEKPHIHEEEADLESEWGM